MLHKCLYNLEKNTELTFAKAAFFADALLDKTLTTLESDPLLADNIRFLFALSLNKLLLCILSLDTP